MTGTMTIVAEGWTEAIPVQAVKADGLDAVLQSLPERERRFALAQGFKGESGRHILLPDADGNIARILFGLGATEAADQGSLLAGRLAALPQGTYRLAGGFADAGLATLAFALGGYRFDRYR